MHKCSTANRMDPLQYEGITLGPEAFKLYCGVTNNQLVQWSDNNNILCDEQNGFSNKSIYVEHISSITLLVETRKTHKLSAFAAFIDFQKAYGTVNRSLLF